MCVLSSVLSRETQLIWPFHLTGKEVRRVGTKSIKGEYYQGRGREIAKGLRGHRRGCQTRVIGNLTKIIYP